MKRFTMKMILKTWPYLLFPLAGLIWAIGCSTTPTGGGGGPGGGGGGSQYILDITAQPDSVYTDTGSAVIYCTLTQNDTALVGAEVHFNAASEDVSNSVITGLANIDTSAETGTNPVVHYYPHNYLGDRDTIYAVYKGEGNDTLAWDSTIVRIIHP